MCLRACLWQWQWQLESKSSRNRGMRRRRWRRRRKRRRRRQRRRMDRFSCLSVSICIDHPDCAVRCFGEAFERVYEPSYMPVGKRPRGFEEHIYYPNPLNSATFDPKALHPQTRPYCQASTGRVALNNHEQIHITSTWHASF